MSEIIITLAVMRLVLFLVRKEGMGYCGAPPMVAGLAPTAMTPKKKIAHQRVAIER